MYAESLHIRISQQLMLILWSDWPVVARLYKTAFAHHVRTPIMLWDKSLSCSPLAYCLSVMHRQDVHSL